MKQADLDRAERLSTQRQEYENIAYRNVCAICSSALLVRWNGHRVIYELVCSKDPAHLSYERLQSLYKTWRHGGTLPVEVAQAFEHKYGKRRKS